MYNTNRKQSKRSNDKRRRECYFEERLDEIVKIVNERGSISNQELVKMFGASESTIRRDITTLANDNRVIRVHGGAMSVVSGGGMEDSEVSARRIQKQ